MQLTVSKFSVISLLGFDILLILESLWGLTHNGDHTYGVDDENMSIVSVEGITNTGDKLDKDHTTISDSVKAVTIKKITFTVDSGAYKVDITKDISSNPYVISFK